MKTPQTMHCWSVTPTQAVAIQRDLAPRIVRRGSIPNPRLVAGADLAFTPDRKHCIAGVVLWDIRSNETLEQHVVRTPVTFPYIPGLLSFREAPAILQALRRLRQEPDLFLFDGQGYAHPRRFGLASHVGLLIDHPAIGCAKSLLIGDCRLPAVRKGATSPIIHKSERIGTALRTRENVKPIYVSVGHRLSLTQAVTITLACTTRFRIPQPTRLADILVTKERTRLS